MAPIECGVPQGSVLGPWLFLLYINDMTTCVKSSETILFVDDILLNHYSKGDMFKEMTDEVNHVNFE